MLSMRIEFGFGGGGGGGGEGGGVGGVANHAASHEPSGTGVKAARFNVLVAGGSDDQQRESLHWSAQLPRLLEPQGVHAFVARCGKEVVSLVEQEAIHAALVDLSVPRDASDASDPGGMWLLRVCRRLPRRPPLVIVNGSRQPQRQAQRLLNEALRHGAFAVVNQPQSLEALLAVIRRILDRQHQGQWPKQPPTPPL